MILNVKGQAGLERGAWLGAHIDIQDENQVQTFLVYLNILSHKNYKLKNRPLVQCIHQDEQRKRVRKVD